MKKLIFIFIIATLSCCNSGEARSFEKVLDSADKKSFRILVSDDLEEKRLQALVDKKPDVATSIAKKQIKELTALIDDIAKKDVSGLEGGVVLQEKALNYYRGYLQLKKVDLNEAELMTISMGEDTTMVTTAVSNMSHVPFNRMKIYRIITENDQAMHTERQKFKETYNIP